MVLEQLVEELEEEPEYIVKKFVKYLMAADEDIYYKLKRYAVFNNFDRLIDIFNEAESPANDATDGVWEFEYVDGSGALPEDFVDEVNKLLRGKTIYDRFREEDSYIKEKVVELMEGVECVADSKKLSGTLEELKKITYEP